MVAVSVKRRDQGRFPFSPKFRRFRLEIKWNRSIGPNGISGTTFEGQSNQTVLFHLTKLLFPVPLFSILFTRTITKRAVAWVGCVQPECKYRSIRSIRHVEFPEFQTGILLNGKHPRSRLVIGSWVDKLPWRFSGNHRAN